MFFAFLGNINAQQGFRIGVNVGKTLGESSELYSFTLQGNFYYFWELSDNIDLGLNTGALVFLGEGKNTSESYFGFESIPDVYIPAAMALRISLSKIFSIGLDTGYGFNVADGDGFYVRPLLAYNTKEKVAIIGSYSNVNESGYNASSINLGINFGF